MPEASDQKVTSLGKRSSTGDSDNENERCPEQKGSQSRAEAELGGQSMSAEALRRLRRSLGRHVELLAAATVEHPGHSQDPWVEQQIHSTEPFRRFQSDCTGLAGARAARARWHWRISNRESARRLRKQRNEKLNSLLSQQDNLQGINDCLKAQISAAKDELLRLTDENRGMLLQLGEDAIPTIEAATRPLTDADSVAKPSRTDKNGPAMASQGPSPASSGGLMPAPPPRAIEASTGASSSDLPHACNAQNRDHPDSTSDSMAANGASPQGDGTQQGASLRSASSSAQQSAQAAPASTMMTRSSHRAHNTTPKVDMRVAIQELTNVKANAAAGSAAATAAAKAAAAAAAATSPNISSGGHSVPDSMASGFLDRPQAIGVSLGMSGALPTASLSQPWAHQPVD